MAEKFNFVFEEAVREKSKLRMGICGPSKHGKTFTSLSIANGLLSLLIERGEDVGNGRICLIDSEHDSSKKYARKGPEDNRVDRFSFVRLKLTPPYSPEKYIAALQAAEKEGFPIIIIDQISHEWDGVGGTLQINAKTTEESSNKNSYIAWQKSTPRHQAFVEAWNASSAHVICTMRAKIKHRIVKETKEIVKLGFKPIARDTTEYEFDIYGMMAIENKVNCIKFDGTRFSEINNQTFPNPGRDFGRMIGEWLLDGEVSTEVERGDLDADTVKKLQNCFREANFTNEEMLESFTKRGASKITQLSKVDADELIRSLKKIIKQEKMQNKGDVSAPEPTPEPVPEPTPEPVVKTVSEPIQETTTEPASEFRKFWVYHGETTTEFNSEDIQDFIYQDNLDINTLLVLAQDEPEGTDWKTAADYGFVAAVSEIPPDEPDEIVNVSVPVSQPPVVPVQDIGKIMQDQLISQGGGESDFLERPEKMDRSQSIAYMNSLVKYLGINEQRFKKVLIARGANKRNPKVDQLNVNQIMLIIDDDLEPFKGEKDKDPESFNSDEWEFECESS